MTIGFIGAGNMASALIAGLINGGLDPKEIISSSPEDSHLLSLEYRIWYKDNERQHGNWEELQDCCYSRKAPYS